MNTILDLIDQTWNLMQELLSSTSLQMFLLVGSGLLTICLLIVAMTRWGHSRPIWKCVVLSVGAHILLLGYAYGTRLVYVAPTSQPQVAQSQDEQLEINLIEEGHEEEEIQERIESEAESWNQFVNRQPLPQLEKLGRPEVDSQIVIDRQPGPIDFDRTDSTFDRNEPLPKETGQPVNQLGASQLLSRFRRQQGTERFRVVKAQRVVPGATPSLQKRDQLFTDLENQDIRAMQRPIKLVGDPNIVPDKQPPTKDQDVFQLRAFVPESDGPVDNSAPIAPEGFLQPSTSPTPVSLSNIKIDSTVRLGDGQAVPELYSLRNASRRMEILSKRGGSIETEQAVESALLWLANNQETDGSWNSARTGGGQENRVFGHDRDGAGANADTGITGLAVLAFLAGGHSQMEGPYRDNVRAALDFLIRSQDASGSFAGGARLYAKMYCHSMSLLAISEAWALTGDAELQAAVEKGVGFTLGAQNTADGGWRYQPGDTGDMSQFGWQVMALHSAELAGMEIPQENKEAMATFLDRCSQGQHKGLASYRPGQAPNTVMTAEAFVARKMLGQPIADPLKQETMYRITGELPSAGKVNLYYWYYATMATYFAGGPEWDAWNTNLKESLISTQILRGTDRGSWQPNGLWGSYGGRVYSTSMAALMLQVYYRYLPTSHQ